MEIQRVNYTVHLSEPSVYVDNQARGRSGHMSHAMAPLGENGLIDFNSNCSAVRYYGHSAFGWVEYRTSYDGGKTYSAVKEFPYSINCFYDGVYTISVEKAVTCDDGTVVAFCLRNCQTDPCCCEPWDTPFIVTSADNGATWSEPREMTAFKGRVYDAIYVNHTIYALMFCNEHHLGKTAEHRYIIFASTDSGKSFTEHAVLPFNTFDRAYGSLLFDGDLMHAFAYNAAKECELDHIVSHDFGKTWEQCPACFLKEGIRNPQTAFIDGIYVIHGRNAACNGFVLYTSEDGKTFDEGIYIVQKDHRTAAYYSNNICLKDEDGPFLLIQYSDTYINSPEDLKRWVAVATVNVMHVTLRVSKNKKF